MDQSLEAVVITAKGVGNGILTVGSEVGESASKVAQHDYGDGAKKMVDSGRNVGVSVACVAKELFEGTNVPHNTARMIIGATRDDQIEDPKENKDKD